MGDVRQHPAAIGTAGDQGDRLHQGDQGLDSTSDGRVGDVRQHPAAIGAGDQGLDSTSDGRMGDVSSTRPRSAPATRGSTAQPATAAASRLLPAWSIGTATSSTAPATATWAT